MNTNENENIYFRARKEAARHDDRLSSREKASELLGISTSQLANYELGICKTVPVDAVVMMADLYHAPELKNRYCAENCPIGAQRTNCTAAGSVERLAVAMACLKNDGAIEKATQVLLEIARDGEVTDEEREQMRALAKDLTGLERLIQAIRLKGEEG